ncbi:MAG: bifunctional adenosylcobinamide kinase/adenosylcobinamide-phosphate guanylyltransferase [Nitrospirae bacterium]|nr:bifunctional adenosylcobinamide kinase/adenosylcobinamide-phosphate guanylyltransferase [Nitrospirota bacterium]
MSMKITFIIGGARSGKSSFALELATKVGVRGGDKVSPMPKKAYIATAEALDEEMKARIVEHRRTRGNDWDTYEAPKKITSVLLDIKGKYDVIVLDCLTLWLSNVMHSNLNTEKEIENLIKILSDSSLVTRHSSLIFLVSNEVGMGIVPENELARKFRDLAGFLNQKVAELADEVYLITAGIPIQIKKSKIKNQN